MVTHTQVRMRGGFSALAVIFMGLLLGSHSAAAALATKADFIELEPIDFSFQREGPTLKFRSSRARVFYSFQLADPEKNPAQAPLFVFFNGGPGCPTCEGLLSTNTARRSIYLKPWGPTDILESSSNNPHRWTSMGNLLYIDAPTTGFSYNIAEVPPGAANAQLYDAQNYNPYIDAAQMVRVLLRFLGANPEIRNNPVVLVGESYGGTRVTVMLNMLLNYRRYTGGTDVYADAGLATEVQRFLDGQNTGSLSGRIYAPARIAQQFGRQVLIQPQLTGRYQSEITGDLYERNNSVIYQLAQAKGKTFTPCPTPGPIGDPAGCEPAANAVRFVINELDLSPYDTRRKMIGGFPESLYSEAALTVWMWAHFAVVNPPSEILGVQLRDIANLNVTKRSGLDPKTRVPWYGYDRKYPPDPWTNTAALVGIPPAERPWFEVLPEVIEQGQAQFAQMGGADAAWGDSLMTVFGRPLDTDKDAIYNTCPPIDVYNTFYRNSATKSPDHPERYDISPESPRYGRLFLENLPFVKTMITDASLDLVIYSPALAPSLERYSGLVKGAVPTHDCPDANCDGTIEVEYQPTAAAQLRTVFPRRQTIAFPHYGDSGHSVTAGMPEKFLGDVKTWMAKP